MIREKVEVERKGRWLKEDRLSNTEIRETCVQYPFCYT